MMPCYLTKSLIRGILPIQPRKQYQEAILIVLVLVFGISQIWTIVRLRQLQRQLTNSASNSSQDNEWGFGQIVAVLLFMPVFVEFLFRIRDHE